MREILIILIGFFVYQGSYAQNELSTKPHLFFSTGFVTPQFFGGEELLASRDLRQQGLSYQQGESGERKMVGNYPANTGFSLSIGYYLPIRQVKGLGIGLLVNSGQTGSNPSQDGYAEGYFFNFLNFGVGLHYYPFETFNLYAKGEIGMGSVFTKNRFVDSEGQQDFLHHFGIGLEGGGAVGYTFTPFTNKKIGINIEGLYQLYSTRVEVSKIGNDQWQFGALHIGAGLQF